MKHRPESKSAGGVAAAALTILKNDPTTFLLQQSGVNGDEFSIEPLGWPISVAQATAIIARADIVPGNDGLLTNSPQTWRAR